MASQAAGAVLKPPDPLPDDILDAATVLVDSGRVVPALAVGDDGLARSWWWPLPSAPQRPLVAALVGDPSPAGQRATAALLAHEVDGLVRARLLDGGAVIAPRRSGRPSLVQAWLRSLVSPEPVLVGEFDPAKVAALAAATQAWVRSGAVVGGQVRLCLRIHEPADDPDQDDNPDDADDPDLRRKRLGPRPSWVVELLAQDRDEPSLVVPLADVWDGTGPFGMTAVEECLVALARLGRLAPELRGFLDQAAPSDLAVEQATVVSLLRDRLVGLDDAGIGVLLPSWWSGRRHLGLRARARSVSSPGGTTPGGVGMDAIIDFSWEAALGGDALTDADLDALARAADAKQALVRVRGVWVEVDPGAIGQMLARAGKRGTATAADLLRAGLGLGDLGAPPQVEVLGVDAAEVDWLSSLLDGALHTRVEPVATPPRFQGQLRPYQERGVGWLRFLSGLGLGACLADDMGLGKTAQLVATVLADPTPGPTLVVCPVSVLGNWQRELARFAPHLAVLVHHGAARHDGTDLEDTDTIAAPTPARSAAAARSPARSHAPARAPARSPAVSLAAPARSPARSHAVSPKPARSRAAPEPSPGPAASPKPARSPAAFARRVSGHEVVLTTYSLLARDAAHLAAVEWSRVAFDEAQQVKNPGAAQTRAAQAIRAPRRIALTGTPVENRLTELWSIMHLLNPGLLGSQGSFRERFSVPIERDHNPEAAELLRRVTGPFVLRRLKTDRSIITDLPDKIETVDRCPLTKEQASLYRAVVDDLLEAADESEGVTRRGLVLAGLTRLKQVCNHPAHFLADGSALAGRSGKLSRAEELLEEILAEGDKVLCFTQFAAWGERLRPYLSRRFGVEALWLHGGVRRTARDEIVERFQADDGPPLLLLSLKAGGTGLNLTAASHVIHVDRWWNPAVEDQATDRAFRIGQRRNVQVHKLVSSGTIEERIDEMITTKRALAERVVGAGEGWLTELSTDELRDVLTLRGEGD